MAFVKKSDDITIASTHIHANLPDIGMFWQNNPGRPHCGTMIIKWSSRQKTLQERNIYFEYCQLAMATREEESQGGLEYVIDCKLKQNYTQELNINCLKLQKEGNNYNFMHITLFLLLLHNFSFLLEILDMEHASASTYYGIKWRMIIRSFRNTQDRIADGLVSS